MESDFRKVSKGLIRVKKPPTSQGADADWSGYEETFAISVGMRFP